MYCELVEFHTMLLFTRMFKCTMSGFSVYIIFPCDLFHAQEPAVASVPSRLSFFFTSLLRDYHLTSWNSNQALKTGGRYRNCQWMFSFCLNYWNEKWFVFNFIDRLHLFWALFLGLSCPPSCLGRTVLWQASPLFSRLLEELWYCLEPGWQEDVPGIDVHSEIHCISDTWSTLHVHVY